MLLVDMLLIEKETKFQYESIEGQEKGEGEELMKKLMKTLEFKFERTIPAPPSEVFDAWLNPKIPGTPWHEGDKLILNPKVDGLFYWLVRGNSHYGRFTEIERPGRIQHTWMSRNTLGEESMVTLTFKKKGEDTLMTLVHSDLPDTDEVRSHDYEKGWNYFLNIFPQQFENVSKKGNFGYSERSLKFNLSAIEAPDKERSWQR